MAINRTLLELRFQEHTNCTPAKAQEHTKKYLKACATAMIQDHFSSDAGSNYFINQTKIQETLNTVMVKGQRFYIWQTFQSFKERVFDIIQTGNNINKELSMAHSRYTLEDVVMAAGTPEEFWNEIYKKNFSKELLLNEYDTAKIDMRSLANYIRSNITQPRDNPKTPAKLIEEWDENLKHAQKIQALAQATDGELVQIISESAFGRKYYKGPNLQNTPKIVRHAALGNCHEYDLESSVFAWKLSWFKIIHAHRGTTASMPSTLEYLDHKKAIRRKLAKTVFDTESNWAVNVIKDLITAIGFGAPARSQGYAVENRYQKPALATIIKSKERLDRALADPWLSEFIQEQKIMNQYIIDTYRLTGQDSEFYSIPELLDKAGKLKPNSAIAYLYQTAEREMLDWFEEFCADSDVLLTVHDCIYTRKKVNIAELRYGILKFGEYFKIGHEEHHAWTWEDPVDKNDPFYDPRESRIEKFTQAYLVKETGCYTGAGHDGTKEYNIEDDPYYMDQNDR